MKLARFLQPYRLWVILAPLLMVLEVAMDLLQPRFVAHIIDAGIARNDYATVQSTLLWMIGAALIGLAGGGAYARMYAGQFHAEPDAG